MYLITTYNAHAKIGCMDNSMHLKEAYDTKTYHYVACNCPCRTLLSRYNKCLECQHVHKAQPFIFVAADQIVQNTNTYTPPKPIHETMKQLVHAYVNQRIKKGNTVSGFKDK